MRTVNAHLSGLQRFKAVPSAHLKGESNAVTFEGTQNKPVKEFSALTSKKIQSIYRLYLAFKSSDVTGDFISVYRKEDGWHTVALSH